jgi:hypothetical protein
MRAYITAGRPADVARDVELWRKRGCRWFILRQVSGGGELDRERLGAARYAAGLHAEVELEGDASDVLDAASR